MVPSAGVQAVAHALISFPTQLLPAGIPLTITSVLLTSSLSALLKKLCFVGGHSDFGLFFCCWSGVLFWGTLITSLFCPYINNILCPYKCQALFLKKFRGRL